MSALGQASERVRVAVTGLGAVSPAGGDAESSLTTVLAGRPAAQPIAAFDASQHSVRFACPVTDFDGEAIVGPKEARRIDRVSLLGIAAAEEALGQAGLDSSDVDPARVAVLAGTGVGGLTTLEDQIAVRVDRGPSRVSPFLVPMMMTNATAGLLSMRHGFTGASLCISTACASGANAIGEGLRMIRSRGADVVLAGGTEATITPTAMAAFARMGALSGRNDDPASASRPFDRHRDGFVMGEGAGFLVLERWDVAERRGADILGELAGYGATCDAHHITAPHPDGLGAVGCMRQALDDADLDASDIGHVNAHGTSTPLNDLAESEALLKVFGSDGPPVTSTKGVTGHLVGAAGALEAVFGLLCAARGVVPPTANFTDPDPEVRVDVVTGGVRSIDPGPMLSNSFGFGGHNATLVLVPAI